MNKYINKEDYLTYKGIDLETEIQDDDNHSNKVIRFVHEVTDWCLEYLVRHYDCNELLGRFDELKEFRQDYFRKGVMEQIEYILNNGLLMQDSGLNRELTTIVDLSRIELSRNAYQKFFMGAFCNIVRYWLWVEI